MKKDTSDKMPQEGKSTTQAIKRKGSTATAAGSQTHRSPCEKRPFPLADHSELPSRYDVTRLVLMPRDPYKLFAYWEISQSSAAAAMKTLGSTFETSRLVLRIYDVTCIDFKGNNANHHFDIDITGTANHWYIELWRDNVSYCADLGFLTPKGGFVQIVRSNFVTMPSATVRAKQDELWMEAPPVYQTPAGGEKGNAKSRKQVMPRTAAVSPNPRQKKKYLSEDAIRAYYRNIYPTQRRTAIGGEKVFRSEPSSGPGIRKMPSDEPEPLALSPESALAGMRAASSGGLPFPGASGGAFVSSGERVQGGKQPDDFYFELGTELIVYGRTRPDAALFFEGKRISLRKDGTFSLRIALPDGKIPLGFKAVSRSTKLVRRIKTDITRSHTDYSEE